MTKNKLTDEYKSLTTAQLQDIIKLIHENLEIKLRSDYENSITVTVTLFGNEVSSSTCKVK